MSTSQVGNSSQIHAVPNGDSSPQSPLYYDIEWGKVYRIAFTFSHRKTRMDVHYSDGSIPAYSFVATNEKGRNTLQQLANGLCLREWPSLVYLEAGQPMASYFGPEYEVLQNIKADRRAEIAIIAQSLLDDQNIDPQTRNDVWYSSNNLLNCETLTAYDLKEGLSELVSLAQELGQAVELC